jgi:signal transduction histidine kinase
LEQLAISRERNRLARELHDTLAHTLSGLAVQLDAIATLWKPTPPKAAAMLEEALTQTRAGLDETRRALRALRATRLEDLGLGPALGEMAKNVAMRDGLSLDLDIGEEIVDLPAEIEQAYYRVAQEALENAARHAQASHISVSLRQRGGELVLVVADDGRGLANGAQSGDQLGLRGMRERAELIDGQMEVESQPGQGTRISLRSTLPKASLPTVKEEP